MRTIRKFEIDKGSGAFEVTMPRNADILCVQVQEGFPHLCAIVDDEAPSEMRRVVVVGTGWGLPDDIGRGDYIGTYPSDGGYFVWHVFASKIAV